MPEIDHDSDSDGYTYAARVFFFFFSFDESNIPYITLKPQWPTVLDLQISRSRTRNAWLRASKLETYQSRSKSPTTLFICLPRANAQNIHYVILHKISQTVLEFFLEKDERLQQRILFIMLMEIEYNNCIT